MKKFLFFILTSILLDAVMIPVVTAVIMVVKIQVVH